MSRRHRGGDDDRIVYGLGPIDQLLRRRSASIRRLAVRAGARGRVADLAARATRAGVRVEILERPDLDRLAGRGATHQGAVAVAGPYEYADFDELLESGPTLLLVLDGITDPRNLGAICRSALLLGADAIVVAKDRSAPINSAATKAAAGATECIAVAEVTNLARALGDLRDAGLWRARIAASPDARPLTEIDASLRLALVLGSEGSGIRPHVARQTDLAYAIPMASTAIDSLNVAVAAALALYEVTRGRGGGIP